MQHNHWNILYTNLPTNYAHIISHLKAHFQDFFSCHYASMIGAFPLPLLRSWASIDLILRTMILRLSFSSQI
jgi:hypothetical protein